MKRTICFFLILALVLSCAPFALADEAETADAPTTAAPVGAVIDRPQEDAAATDAPVGAIVKSPAEDTPQSLPLEGKVDAAQPQTDEVEKESADGTPHQSASLTASPQGEAMDAPATDAPVGAVIDRPQETAPASDERAIDSRPYEDGATTDTAEKAESADAVTAVQSDPPIELAAAERKENLVAAYDYTWFNQKVAQIKSDYPEGTTWTNNNSYPNGWYGCWAFANIMADRIFGTATPRNSWSVTSAAEIVPGDIISTDVWNGGGWTYGHTMFVIGVNGNTLTLAEGNYAGKIKYGRQLGRYAESFTVYHANNYNSVISNTPATYTNYVNHWAGGFKNGEGNNSAKNAFKLGVTSWTAQVGTSQTYSTGMLKSIRGFTGRTIMGSGDFSGTWTEYNLPYTFTQPAKNIGAEYDYNPIQYKITYNLNGGTNNASNPSTYNVLYGVTFAAPTKTGYTFKGWKDGNGNAITGINKGANASFSSVDAFYSAVNSRTIGNITITAQWTANPYSVTFDPNGGSVSTTSKTVTYGSTYGDLPTPTRTGYKFAGWYTAASGGSQVTSSTKVTATANHKLYAHWTANQITVTLNANGGSVSPTSIKVTYGGTYANLPTPTRTGYKFSGWFTAKTGGTQVKTTTTVGATSNITIYAQWTPITSTVTFNPKNGTVSPTSKSVTYDSTYGDLPTPTCEGYVFDGWYTEFSGGSKVTSSTKVTATANHTLYAHWNVSITVRPNSGTWNGSTSDTTQAIFYGANLDLGTPTREGYEFAGWMLEHSGADHVLSPYGKPMTDDPSFKTDLNSVEAYNNKNNGYVTVNRVSRSSDCPTTSDYMLQVITTGEAIPGYGGFVQRTSSKAGGVFYHTVVAKLPKGYKLSINHNSCGDGAKFTWLTPNNGTGKFEFYAYKLTCGTTGKFSTFGHLALKDATATEEYLGTDTAVPIVWYVAYSQMFDATGLTLNGNELTVGNAPATLTAMWRVPTIELNWNVDGVDAQKEGSFSAATADVYVGGVCAAENVTQFVGTVANGEEYEIRINCAGGYEYKSCSIPLSGTIASDTTATVYLTSRVPQDAKPTAVETYNEHTYAYYDIPTSWTAANAFCQSKGGHLVTVTDAEENEFVKNLCGEIRFWLGGTDAEEEGTWKWVTDEPFAYTDWMDGYPANMTRYSPEGEDYVYINEKDGKWHDNIFCAAMGFVMEKDSTYMPGDCNGDGAVNMRDVLNLRQSMAGGYGVSIDASIADLNHDGSVNMRDLLFLRQYLAGGYGIVLT